MALANAKLTTADFELAWEVSQDLSVFSEWFQKWLVVFNPAPEDPLQSSAPTLSNTLCAEIVPLKSAVLTWFSPYLFVLLV